MNVVEEITVSPTPPPGQHTMVPISWTLVTSATRDNIAVPEMQNIRVDIIFPDATHETGATAVLDLTTAPRSRCFIGIPGFVVKGIGDHVFAILFQDATGAWNLVSEWHVQVVS